MNLKAIKVLLAIITNLPPFFFFFDALLSTGMVLNEYKQQQAGPGAHYMLVSMTVKGNKEQQLSDSIGCS